ncbi:predicted protein [Aspergillus terreus NIH2624]|uniref:Uncharacterized protein n=1 Tax=Aspergillus terreus (strain NIH 2624 / FGSC A1156) TaxID=341663 RepID=Q0CAN9_ASPTN|nr:uncharacterized protein ATEG_09245 [Aspergillus terreus NIH2624]EAU30382.1 predicted protein [Aspergillus terreus NIH2624]
MYDSAPPLDLQYIKSQHLPRRYDSEEEEISESELGGQENAFSPVESYKAPGTCDSDTSTDELSNAEDERAAHFARLLPPYSSAGLGSRPVSMDTVKRSSGTTFVADSYIFDHDDDVIIELPSPDATSPMTSPTFLQPTVYVPPESPVSMRPSSSRSSSPTSMLSDDDTDVLVAEQVTFVKPRPKPSLILISPAPEQSAFPFKPASPAQTTLQENDLHGAGSSDAQPVYSLTQAAQSQPALGDFQRTPRSKTDAAKRGSLQLSLRGHDGQPIGPGAATAAAAPSNPLASLAEVPEQTTRPMSVRSQSISFSRPKTAFSEKSASGRSRLPTAAGSMRRPPSLQSLSSVFHSRHASLSPHDDPHARTLPYSHSNASSEYSVPSPTTTSLRASPAPSPTTYYSAPNFTRDRSGSSYSTSSRSPLPIRNSIMKSSTASSLYSGSSLRSEVESVRSLDPSDVAETEPKPHSRRKKSMRSNKLSKTDGSEPSSAKSFMGFMFRGKRRSTINTLNA